MSDWKVIAFDLDDTLLDTSRLLLPRALNEARDAMIKSGLSSEVPDFERLRHEHIREKSVHGDLFDAIAKAWAPTEPEEFHLAAVGRKAFYSRDLQVEIEPFPSVLQSLEYLKSKYRLHLVTSGTPETQRRKVELLGFQKFFVGFHFVNSLTGEKKQSAFSRILEQEQITPSQLLSVGNRIDSEIEEAKALGCATCLVQYGEYAHLTPLNPNQKPDYEISDIRDLIATCRL